MVKICSKCGKEKELHEFPTSKREKYGVSYECKKCRHQYYLDNRERFIAKSKEQRIKNKEALSEYRKEYAKKNKEKIADFQKEYRKTHKEERLNHQYLRKYNISLNEVKELYKKQDGKCALFGEELKWGRECHLDHDHKTGEVRGLLCYKCNLMVGFAEDNVEKLLAAIDYIKGFT